MSEQERIARALEMIADVLARREAREAQADVDRQSAADASIAQMDSFVAAMQHSAKNQEQLVQRTQEMSDRQAQHIQDCAHWHQLMAGQITEGIPQ